MVHMKQVKNVSHFCVRCNKSYSIRAHLLDHHYHFHNDGKQIKLYKCFKCDKSYTRQGSLSNHIKSHHGKSIFKYPQCQKVLSSKGHLKRHVQSVHNVITRKLYQCYFCSPQSRIFFENSKLCDHMRGVHLK